MHNDQPVYPSHVKIVVDTSTNHQVSNFENVCGPTKHNTREDKHGIFQGSPQARASIYRWLNGRVPGISPSNTDVNVRQSRHA